MEEEKIFWQISSRLDFSLLIQILIEDTIPNNRNEELSAGAQ